jgi:hypothetical protein
LKAYWRSRGIAPRIFDLGIRWRWVVNLTHRPLYSQGKSPWYPLERKLAGPQNRAGRGGEEKNSHVYNFTSTLILKIGLFSQFSWMDHRGSSVRFPAGAGDFSLHHRVQNGSGAHPASCPMGTRGSFLRG